MFTEADIWSIARYENRSILLLKPTDSELVVPINIRFAEAQAILVGLSRVPVPRPLTHDLLIDAIQKGKGEVRRVLITRYLSEIFYAQIVVQKHKSLKRYPLNARASDAVAVASRCRCPIMIAKKVIQEVATDPQKFEPDSDESLHKLEEKASVNASQLSTKLQQAVESEDYEEAARLRDRLKELE